MRRLEEENELNNSPIESSVGDISAEKNYQGHGLEHAGITDEATIDEASANETTVNETTTTGAIADEIMNDNCFLGKEVQDYIAFADSILEGGRQDRKALGSEEQDSSMLEKNIHKTDFSANSNNFCKPIGNNTIDDLASALVSGKNNRVVEGGFLESNHENNNVSVSNISRSYNRKSKTGTEDFPAKQEPETDLGPEKAVTENGLENNIADSEATVSMIKRNRMLRSKQRSSIDKGQRGSMDEGKSPLRRLKSARYNKEKRYYLENRSTSQVSEKYNAHALTKRDFAAVGKIAEDGFKESYGANGLQPGIREVSAKGETLADVIENTLAKRDTGAVAIDNDAKLDFGRIADVMARINSWHMKYMRSVKAENSKPYFFFATSVDFVKGFFGLEPYLEDIKTIFAEQLSNIRDLSELSEAIFEVAEKEYRSLVETSEKHVDKLIAMEKEYSEKKSLVLKITEEYKRVESEYRQIVHAVKSGEKEHWEILEKGKELKALERSLKIIGKGILPALAESILRNRETQEFYDNMLHLFISAYTTAQRISGTASDIRAALENAQALYSSMDNLQLSSEQCRQCLATITEYHGRLNSSFVYGISSMRKIIDSDPNFGHIAETNARLRDIVESVKKIDYDMAKRSELLLEEAV